MKEPDGIEMKIFNMTVEVEKNEAKREFSPDNILFDKMESASTRISDGKKLTPKAWSTSTLSDKTVPAVIKSASDMEGTVPFQLLSLSFPIPGHVYGNLLQSQTETSTSGQWMWDNGLLFISLILLLQYHYALYPIKRICHHLYDLQNLTNGGIWSQTAEY